MRCPLLLALLAAAALVGCGTEGADLLVVVRSGTIDGANLRQRIWHVTIPALRPAIAIATTLGIVNGLRIFDQILALTGGGPGRSTELFSLYAYVHAFLNLDLGRGSAAAIIGGLIILVIGVVLYRLVDRIAKA